MHNNQIDYQHLFNILSSERFLNKQGLGNELPFFICSYDPHDEVHTKNCIKKLIDALSQKTPPVKILSIDLYDLCIELLQNRGILQKVFDIESSTSKADLKELFQNVLDSERHLTPAIHEKMQADNFNILFISGVGEVFPYIRSHNVLNNLQIIAKEQSTLIFFPGKYEYSEKEGKTLQLFGQLPDDKYYRAFDIYDFRTGG